MALVIKLGQMHGQTEPAVMTLGQMHGHTEPPVMTLGQMHGHTEPAVMTHSWQGMCSRNITKNCNDHVVGTQTPCLV